MVGFQLGIESRLRRSHGSQAIITLLGDGESAVAILRSKICLSGPSNVADLAAGCF